AFVTDPAASSKLPLKYENLAKFYILFFAAFCWLMVVIGLLGILYDISFLAFLVLGVVPFPFLLYGYRGIEERRHHLITPLIAFSITLFILELLLLFGGVFYYFLEISSRSFSSVVRDRIWVVVISVCILVAIVPGPIHAIG
ncbi:hypothetical protein PMAYCL1PPCAC_04226, partial [Pristionchus mayeri]